MIGVRPTGWLPLAALGLLVGLTFWLNRLVQEPPVRADGSSRHDPDLIVDDFNARKLGLDGNVLYTLAAKKMVHYPDDDTALLEHVMLEAFEPGQPKLTLTSDGGRIEQKGERVWAEGNVVIVRDPDPKAKTESARLTTDRMLVIPDDGIARTTDPVTIETDSSHSTATSLELDNHTRTMKADNVRSTIKPQR
jgi:lipopolysaccharide export system protein LptC